MPHSPTPKDAALKNNEKCLECIIGFFYWSFWHGKTDAFDKINKNGNNYLDFKSTDSHEGGDFGVSKPMVANRVKEIVNQKAEWTELCRTKWSYTPAAPPEKDIGKLNHYIELKAKSHNETPNINFQSD